MTLEADTCAKPAIGPIQRTLPTAHKPAFHDNGLNLLRLALAIMVIHSHSWYFLRLPAEQELISRLTGRLMDDGALAVNLFFALSGYLVSASWARRPSLTDFLRKRALRIYPGFALVCVWQALLIAPLSLKAWTALPTLSGFGSLLLCIVSLGSFGELVNPHFELFPHSVTGDINGSLWTIRYEFLCYLFLGIFGLKGGMQRRWFRWATFGTFLTFYVWKPDGEMHPMLTAAIGPWEQWARLFVYFLGGMIVYWDTGRVRFSVATITPAVVLLVAASYKSGPWLRAAGPVLLPWLMLHVGYLRWPSLLARRLPGDFSYGIYLFSFPTQQLLGQYTPGVLWNVWTLTLASLCLTLPWAIASWYWVEAPCLGKTLRRKT